MLDEFKKFMMRGNVVDLAVTKTASKASTPVNGSVVYTVRVTNNGPSSVTGIVYDPSGGVLPGVEVTLEDAQRAKFSSVTDGTGRFEFGPLDPGDYRLETTLAGFRPVRLALTLSSFGRNECWIIAALAISS